MKFNRATLLLALLLAPVAVASTTLYVNGVTGSDSNNCLLASTPCKTIGHAISLAASGDSIRVAAAIYAENLNIGKNLTIMGSGAGTTVIDGGNLNTVVTIPSASANVTLSGLAIRHGHALHGGGVLNTGTLTIKNSVISANTAYVSCSSSFCDDSGGGIYNGGALSINHSSITGNKASVYCTDQCATLGGGIFNEGGTLMINNSTISGNSASPSCPFRGAFCHSDGGGIFNDNGTLTISKSTVSGNSANESGGIDNRGTLTISNSTLAGNSAYFTRGNAFGGGISNGGTLAINNSTISGNSAQGGIGSYGGGIYGTATIQNSIVANSTSGGNCYGTMTSLGYNLSSDNSCSFSGAGDLNNTDPLLGPLQYNGGPTQTMALASGSPAIDAGNPTGCTDNLGHPLKTDQRGQPRPDTEDINEGKLSCDMGAYERQSD